MKTFATIAMALVAFAITGSVLASPDKIAYSRSWTAKVGKTTVQYYHIFTMNTDGTNQTQITFDATHGTYANLPKWLPDGRIAYVGGKTISTPSLQAIWVMDADGTNPVRITATNPLTGGDFGPSTGIHWMSVSPNGTHVAFSTGDGLGQYAVAVVPVAGGEPQIVLAEGIHAMQYTPGNWSPDLDLVLPGYQGKLLVGRIPPTVDYPRTVSALDISIDLDGNVTPYTEELLITGWNSAEYSPDGRYVAYYPQVGSLTWDLRVLDTETGAVQVLATAGLASPTWSPDGSAIAFRNIVATVVKKTVTYNTDVCKVNLAQPGTIIRLTTHADWEACPSWSLPLFGLP